MKNRIIVSICLITAIFMWACKKETNDVYNDSNVTEAVKNYFAFTKATSDLTTSNKDQKLKSGTLYVFQSSNLKADSVPPSLNFFKYAFRILFEDSCAYTDKIEINKEGDWIFSRSYGDTYEPGTFEVYYSKGVPTTYQNTIKGGFTSIDYYKKNDSDPSIGSIMMDYQVFFPDENKYYSMAGKCTYTEYVTNEEYELVDMKLKLGEIGNEIEYTLSSKSYYGDYDGHKVTIIEEGSFQHAGKNATFNTTIIKPFQLNQDSRNLIIGTAKVTYTKDGKSGEFGIDYGNGTDNSKATITENGKSYEVDYVELQKEMNSFF